MKTMDGELKQLNEKLYGLYDRSYNIAVEHWLPQVKPNLDSFNSLPHLIGVKKRIDKILYPEDDEAGICLNVAELYVLLNAVLFHDIGKGIDYSVKKYVGDDWKPASSSAIHAYISKITVYENWAELGIISERVARIIGDVCEFHDGAYGNQLPGSLISREPVGKLTGIFHCFILHTMLQAEGGHCIYVIIIARISIQCL